MTQTKGIREGFASPKVLPTLGIIALLSGLTTALIGVDRARRIFDWGLGQGTVLIRACGAGLAVIGAFIPYLAATGRRAA